MVYNKGSTLGTATSAAKMRKTAKKKSDVELAGLTSIRAELLI